MTKPTIDHEPPVYAPRVNRDYDPVHRRWDHLPPAWMWSFVEDPRRKTARRRDFIVGCIGACLVGALLIRLFWLPWM
jgi:hypothetical protein